jgi:hypothetical protein
MKTATPVLRSIRSRKGGVLLTAVIFATISALTIGSFIKLANHELRLSNVQFYSNECINLAEAGLEEALHALNFYNWNGWSVTPDTGRLSVYDVPLGRAATGEFHVLVENRRGDPLVTAEGRVTAGSGLTTTKQVQITLRTRSYFANGVTAREQITFAGGNPQVDSYFSSQGPFTSERRRDRGTVASIYVGTDPIELGNGHIWGYVFTGGQPPRIRNGTILGEDSHTKQLTNSGRVDPSRITRDFSAEFPEPLAPPGPSIPGIPTSDGQFVNVGPYILTGIGSSRDLGTPFRDPSEPEVYHVMGNISLQSDLNILGPVILVVHGNVSIGGSGGLNVGTSAANPENALLRVYAYNDFKITGNGMGNATRIPANLVIFGMNPVHQSFDLGGSARWEAAIYAPNADLDLNGGGSEGHMSGAVVGKNVKLNGNSKFHYDEDLAAFTDAFGFALDTWRELIRIEDRIVFN